MKGLGLAHVLAQALDNSRARFGIGRHWNDDYVNALTTNDGKSRVLGPALDVLRGDAEIVPLKRIVYPNLMKPGDRCGEKGDVVVLNRTRFGNRRVPHRLVIGNFTLGVASRSITDFYEREEEHGRIEKKPSTHIDVPDDPSLLALSKRHLLPRYLLGKMLPGIALRDFYLKNPHHIPSHFHGTVLFWGTICKNDWCYYVPGIESSGRYEYGRRICTYQMVDGKEVITDYEDISINPYDAAVFI
jgi:hypothetical protein